MRNSIKILTAITIGLALSVLSACNSGGGGGGSSSNPNAYWGTVGASGVGGYVGQGTWSGQLVTSNMNYYQQFLVQNGLCNSYQCSMPSPYFQLQISTAQSSGGYLPGPVTLALLPYFQSRPGQWLSVYADGYINASQNGILVNYNGTNSACDPNLGCGGIPQANMTMLQINTTWVDPSHSTLNVQVLYLGVPIATGQLISRGYMGLGYSNNGGYGSGSFYLWNRQHPGMR